MEIDNIDDNYKNNNNNNRTRTIVKSLRIDEDLHKQIKLYCVKQSISLQAFIYNTLKEKLDEINKNNNIFR